MSPLSSNARWRNIFGPRAQVRLYVGRDKLIAAHIETDAAGNSTRRRLREHRFAMDLFTGAPSEKTAAAIIAAIAALWTDMAREYLPVQVVLPDAAASYAIFELDEIPKEADALRDLVRWRLAKELHHNESTIECRCQPLGRDGDKELVLSVAIDRAWINCILAACERAGLMVTAADLSLAYRFNDSYAQITAHKGDGLLIALDIDSWSVTLWDREARVRFARSRWRKPGGNELAAESATIAAEVARNVSAYLRPGSGRTIAHAFLAGERDTAEAIAALLPSHLSGATYIAASCDWVADSTVAAASARVAAVPR